MRFAFVKYICIILFITTLTLFTIGYANEPLLNVRASVALNLPTVPIVPNVTITLPNIPTLPNNGNFKFSLYMDYIINNIDNSKINYSDVNGTLDSVTNIIKFVFIGVSAFLGMVIILSFIGLKTISYIPLLIALNIMIILCIVLILIYSTKFVTGAITDFINKQSEFIKVSNTSINYDTGGILITVATGILLVNYFLYMMLG